MRRYTRYYKTKSQTFTNCRGIIQRPLEKSVLHSEVSGTEYSLIRI